MARELGSAVSIWTLDRGEEVKLRRDEDGVINATGLWLLARASSNKIMIPCLKL